MTSKSDLAVSVRGLSKSYAIAHNAPQHTTMAEALVHMVKSPRKKHESETFWALKDVDFDIKKGEVVGIIGRNGAGKSTLLKVLSRITEPTSGQIDLYGRVGSLLEVGTGFHPELTGRENIYMNGSILGMTKREIATQFDAIVDFSGTEQFLDTPVKRYSSGMYVRLAFAVAAHLNPEILIVDEVLSVGDAEFQKKCLGKLQDVSRQEGRTILFVSHNMGAISSLCNRAVFLHQGKCLQIGSTNEVMTRYMMVENDANGQVLDESILRPQQKLKIRCLRVTDRRGSSVSEFECRDDVFLEVEFEVAIPGAGYDVSIELSNLEHGPVFCTCLRDVEIDSPAIQYWAVGSYKGRIKLPTEYMRGGRYLIKAAAAVPNVEVLDRFEPELHFQLLDTGSPESKMPQRRRGSILPILPWQISTTDCDSLPNMPSSRAANGCNEHVLTPSKI